ncbi:uncharacterized protein LOC102805389 [Saccoglossus kowalevskii]|uniref:Protein CASP-like n=1 Tax=Saccoglossus kowalevskii TaxID=10224 RepID=A0ABM0MFI7_SACKO|nr:PREDICTED: protein CASP-like [Saccoglossus kowalevskii]
MAGGRKRGRVKKQEKDKDEDKKQEQSVGQVVEEGPLNKMSKLSTKRKDTGGASKNGNQLYKQQKETDDGHDKCKTLEPTLQHDQNSDEFSLSQCPSSQLPLSQAAKFVPSFGKRKKPLAATQNKMPPKCDILQEVSSTELEETETDADKMSSEKHAYTSGMIKESVLEKEKSNIEKEKSSVLDNEQSYEDHQNTCSQETNDGKMLQDTVVAISDSIELKAESTLQTKQNKDDKTKLLSEKEAKDTVDVADVKNYDTFSILKSDKIDCSDQEANIQIVNEGTGTIKHGAHIYVDELYTPKGNKNDISVSEEIKSSPLFEAVCKLEEEMSNTVKVTDSLIGNECSVTPPEVIDPKQSINNNKTDKVSTEQLKIGFPNTDVDFVAECSETGDRNTTVQETVDKLRECDKDMKNDESMAKTSAEEDHGEPKLEDQSRGGIITSLLGASNVTCSESTNNMQVVDDFTDITDSQLCMIEEDWQTTSKSETTNTEQGSVRKTREPLYVSMPTKFSLPDEDKGTKMAQGLIQELTSLNRMVLNAKREMEAVKKQRQQRLKRSTNQKPSTTSKGYGASSSSFI